MLHTAVKSNYALGFAENLEYLKRRIKRGRWNTGRACAARVRPLRLTPVEEVFPKPVKESSERRLPVRLLWR